MKKNSNRTRSGGKIFVRKWMMKMKIVFIFLICSLMQVHATVHAQQSKVSVELKNVALEKVFLELERQTGYSFLYNHREVMNRGNVSVQVENQKLKTVLEDLLPRLGLAYSFDDNLVIIKVAAKQEPEKKSVRVKGFVYDTGKHPMPGVTVKIMGISMGTATDANGWFAMDLPMQKGMLEFSFIGFKKKTIEFNERTVKDTLRVILEEEVLALDETVVVGYGTTTKRETTGSISVIKGEDLKGIPVSNLANLLQGRVAGMDITQMSGSPGGGGTSIVIRGYNSLDVEQGRRFSNPLWVVDGVPLNSFTSPVTGTNLLADINPDMIESIQILKDASAASIYGSRAANGVIIVTTKKGKKEQNATFSVNASQSWGILPRLPDITIGRMERWMRLLSQRKRYVAYFDVTDLTYKYPTSLKDIYDRKEGSLDANWIPFPSNKVSNGSSLQDSLNPFYNNATNFFPMYYETAKTTNANIQAYGGSERMTYGLGLGYYDEGGIVKGTGFKRVDLNLNLNVEPVKRFNLDMRFNATLVNRRRGTNASGFVSDGEGGHVGSAPSIETVPGDPYKLSTMSPGAGSAPWEAALENLKGTKEANRNIRLRTNFKLNYEVIEGMNISSSLAADYSIARRNYFQPSYFDSNNRSQSLGETGINLMVLNEELFSYKKTFGEDHNFTLMAGFAYEYDQIEYNAGCAMNSPSDKIHYAPGSLPSYGIEEAFGTSNVIPFKFYESNMEEKVLISYFARLEYNFREKYLLSVSCRRDGSSTFGAKHRWGTFPSVAAGWSFSEEPIVKDNLGWLSFGKIRASWGRSGMHFQSPYLALGLVENGPNFQGNGALTPDFANGLYNEDLSWENTDQYDLGLDLDFFNYRVGVVLDYYYRYTTDLLMQVPLSPPNTYSRQWRNAAAISNEGIELLLKFNVFMKPDLFWRISVNGAKNWNKFRKSYSGYDERGWIIGKPLNGIYGMLSDGYVDKQEELPFVYLNSEGWKSYMTAVDGKYYFKPGDLKYIDANGDGYADHASDKVYLGSALPEISGGLVSEFRWKNIDVNFSMAYQLGRHIVNDVPLGSLRGELAPFFMDIEHTSFWEKTGDKSEYPSWEASPDYSHFNSLVDRYVEKVNWLKLKTLSVGYTIPQRWLDKLKMKELRVFVSGENLFTWSNYSGLDPESVDISGGFDSGRNYPLARKYTLGLTLKF